LLSFRSVPRGWDGVSAFSEEFEAAVHSYLYCYEFDALWDSGFESVVFLIVYA